MGLPIFLDETTEQNYARSVASQVQHQLLSWGLYEAEDYTAEIEHLKRVSDLAIELAPEINKPDHYGENGPGFSNGKGTPLVPDPFFTYWDLFQFGFYADLPDPPEEYKSDEDAREPEQVLAAGHQLGDILCALGLLECSWAVSELEAGREARATYLLGRAFKFSDSLGWAFSSGDEATTSPTVAREVLSRAGKSGGRASGNARREKQAELIREALLLRQEYRGKRHPETDIAAKVAGRLSIGVSTVRKYFAGADGR